MPFSVCSWFALFRQIRAMPSSRAEAIANNANSVNVAKAAVLRRRMLDVRPRKGPWSALTEDQEFTLW